MTKEEYQETLNSILSRQSERYQYAKDARDDYARAYTNGFVNAIEVALNWSNYLEPNPTTHPIIELTKRIPYREIAALLDASKEELRDE